MSVISGSVTSPKSKPVDVCPGVHADVPGVLERERAGMGPEDQFVHDVYIDLGGRQQSTERVDAVGSACTMTVAGVESLVVVEIDEDVGAGDPALAGIALAVGVGVVEDGPGDRPAHAGTATTKCPSGPPARV